MGQEYFGGPEYFTEFDPEKFARELKAQAAADAAAEKDGAEKDAEESASEDVDGETPDN